MGARLKYYDEITDDKKREMEGEIKKLYEETKRALEREKVYGGHIPLLFQSYMRRKGIPRSPSSKGYVGRSEKGDRSG